MIIHTIGAGSVDGGDSDEGAIIIIREGKLTHTPAVSCRSLELDIDRLSRAESCCRPSWGLRLAHQGGWKRGVQVIVSGASQKISRLASRGRVRHSHMCLDGRKRAEAR